MRRVRGLGVIAGLSLVIVACGGGDGIEASTTTATPSPAPTEVTSTTVESAVTTEASTTTTTAEEPSSTTTVAPTTTTAPDQGEIVDIGPVAGDELGVVGVAHDDVLNVRSGPGVGFTVIGELAPTADDVVAMGETRSIPHALWIRVKAGGIEGWVNLRYVAYLGDTDDITARLIEQLGERPETETMLDMGLLVAEAVAGAADGESDIEPVMSVAPSVGDLGEVTFDVVGFADDSVLGSRLHVFAAPSESGEGFVLTSVEATVLCARGVSGGMCV